MPFLVSGDGVKLHYERTGSGPPLVLHTGGAGEGSMWRDAGYVDELSSAYECLLFDHRGHGRSGQPKMASAHSVQRYAADVVELLDHAGLERVAYWGYSQGGEIGLAVAALYPERIAALITTGVISNPDRAALAVAIAKAVVPIREKGWEGYLDPDRIASMPAWFRLQMQTTNPEMVALWWEGQGAWDPWVRLPQIATPILMFVGELEDPKGWNSRAAELAPDARVVRLTGLDHLGAYIRSDLVLPVAKEFLARAWS